MGSCEDVLRALAGEGQVERVWAQVEVAGPLELAMVAEPHLVEHAFALPRGEDTSAGEVRQVHLAFGTILVTQPNSVARERPDFDSCRTTTNSVRHPGGWVHSLAQRSG